MHLLKNLSADAGMTQKALGSMVNKTPANLTKILDRLEIESLIVRRPDSGDRRENLVFLTDRGVVLVKDVHETFQQFSVEYSGRSVMRCSKSCRSCLKIIDDFERSGVEK